MPPDPLDRDLTSRRFALAMVLQHLFDVVAGLPKQLVDQHNNLLESLNAK